MVITAEKLRNARKHGTVAGIDSCNLIIDENTLSDSASNDVVVVPCGKAFRVVLKGTDDLNDPQTCVILGKYTLKKLCDKEGG